MTDEERRQQYQLSSLGITADPEKTSVPFGTSVDNIQGFTDKKDFISVPAKKTFAESVKTALTGFATPTITLLKEIGKPVGSTTKEVAFNKNKFRISYFINYNGKKELNSLSPSELNKLYLYTSNGSLRWLTHNLNTNINFNSSLDLSISIENIFNVHYRTYSSGISAPGRSLNISCNFIF